MGGLNWFDKKYQEGGKPSLEDRAELFRGLNIKINERARENIENSLKQCLFELEREYKPRLHVLAFDFLFCLAPLINMNEKNFREYVKKYRGIMEKHKDKLVFQCNFEEER